MSYTERELRDRTRAFGSLNPVMKCPHCEQVGTVRTHRVTRKQGLSGGKVAGAVFTLGWSMLATGLSRKVEVTEATCDHCHQQWTY